MPPNFDEKTETAKTTPPLSAFNKTVSIHTIPSELLCLIFEKAQSTSPDSLWLTDGYGLESPSVELRISHVCQRWRHLAVNNPLLWSRVIFTDKLNSKSHADTYLQRSANGDIDVHLHDQKDLDAFNFHLMPHIHRWRSLIVRNDSLVFWYTFLEKLRNESAVRLQYLEFSTRALDEYSEEFDALDVQRRIFIGGTPSLTVFNVVRLGIHCGRPASAPSLRLFRLHNGIFCGSPLISYAFEEFHYGLHSFTSITYLCITGDIFNEVYVGDGRVVLPRLRTICIQCDEEDTPSILNIIEAPMLECVEIKTPVEVEFGQHWAGRAFPTVRHLEVSLPASDQTLDNINAECWQSLWNIFPGVVELACIFDDVYFLVRVEGFTTAAHWPGLCAITIRPGYGYGTELSMLPPLLNVVSQKLLIREISGFPRIQLCWTHAVKDVVLRDDFIASRSTWKDINDQEAVHCSHHEGVGDLLSTVDLYHY